MFIYILILAFDINVGLKQQRSRATLIGNPWLSFDSLSTTLLTIYISLTIPKVSYLQFRSWMTEAFGIQCGFRMSAVKANLIYTHIFIYTIYSYLKNRALKRAQ